MDYTPSTFEDSQILSNFTHETQLAIKQADKNDAGIIKRAQQTMGAYVSVNRNGYTTLVRMRLLDLG